MSPIANLVFRSGTQPQELSPRNARLLVLAALTLFWVGFLLAVRVLL